MPADLVEPIPGWDVHFEGLEDYRKDSTAPLTTHGSQLGGHRQCGLPYVHFTLALVQEALALSHPDTAIVTGAFSYNGRYGARRLLAEGVSVRTLTRNSGREGPFGDLVKAAPFVATNLL